MAKGRDGVEIKSMIDLVQYVMAVRWMGRGLSEHHVVMCKVRLVGVWIKRRVVVVGARRIKSEKLREHQYKVGYARSLEGKEEEWEGDNNVEHMWEQVKRSMVESTREVYGSVQVGERTQRVCGGMTR